MFLLLQCVTEELFAHRSAGTFTQRQKNTITFCAKKENIWNVLYKDKIVGTFCAKTGTHVGVFYATKETNIRTFYV